MKITFTHMAVIFSIAGIVLLYVLSLFARPGEIPLSEVGEHDGETVVVRGVVAQYYDTGRDETVIKICGGGEIVSVVVETGTIGVALGDVLQVTGKVVRISKDYQLQVARATLIKKVGSIRGNMIPLASLESVSGEYIHTEAVVSDIENRDTYRKLTVFDPQSRLELCLYLYDTDSDISIGSELNLTAYVDSTDDGIVLRSYMSEAVAVEGMWESRELGIRRLFESISSNRREFMYFPVNVTGYVLFQPNPLFSSLTISDRTGSGGRVLKVNLAYGTDIGSIDRRDLIMVRGKLRESEFDMGLEMEADHYEILEAAPLENVTTEELYAVAYLYENAVINLEGSVHYSGIHRTIYGASNYTQFGFHWSDFSEEPILPLVVSQDDHSSIPAISNMINGSGVEEDRISLEGRLLFLPGTMGYVYQLTPFSPSSSPQFDSSR